MKDDVRLKIADELLVLEQGQNELLLANGTDVRPLYVNKGRKYIREFLKAAGELGTRRNILRAYPRERSLLDLLSDHGILVPQNGGRPNATLEKVRKGPPSGKRQAVSLYLLLSQSCNMRCIYCLDGAKTYQTDKALRMSREIAFRSVERCLDELDEGGRLEVVFFGGEPLLNWPLAKEVILHCEKLLAERHRGKQPLYHFTSNLSFLPDDLIEWAKKYRISFLCNVDGPAAIHDACRPFKDGRGTYAEIAKNIRLISKEGLQINLRATVTALNQDHLLEVAEEHKALGGHSGAFVLVNPVNSDESILPENLLPSPEKVIKAVTDVYKSKVWKRGELYPFSQYAANFAPSSARVVGCGAPNGNVAVVDVKGDVYPCIYLVGIRRCHVGNVRDDSYPRRDVLERMYDDLHVDHRDDCKRCSWRYICAGGCPLGRLTVLNNPAATAGVKSYCRQICCDYTKSILETLLWERAQETAESFERDAAKAPSCL